MKVIRLFVFALVPVLLAGCEIYVYSDLDGFRLESAHYQSEYVYNGTSVICDDRTTEIELDLRFQGEVDYVSVSLVGERYGERESASSFSPRASENESGAIRRTFNIRSRLSPLEEVLAQSEEDALGQSRDLVSLQSIIVVPVNPTVIGYTAIEVRVESEYEDVTRVSRGIPVLNFCN
jgi:hypothetical protein